LKLFFLLFIVVLCGKTRSFFFKRNYEIPLFSFSIGLFQIHNLNLVYCAITFKQTSDKTLKTFDAYVCTHFLFELMYSV